MIQEEMQRHAAALRGRYLSPPNQPSAAKLFTVHPLGGCIMGVDAEHGVVDHRGRVYDPSQGLTAVHEGLFVADGAIVPMSLGVNPLLTISALAERTAALIDQDAHLDLRPQPFDPLTSPLCDTDEASLFPDP